MEFGQSSARLPKTPEEKERWERVIIVLEHCPLASVMTDKGYQLLSEKHKGIHAKRRQDPAEWRPDVVHQCLLQLMDSALNRSGRLQVFLRTKKGICLMVDPRLRVPRSFRLFEKMMVMLFFKMKIRSSTGYLSLMKVVRNPITDHIPANLRIIRVEKDGEQVDPFAYAMQLGRPASAGTAAGRKEGDSGGVMGGSMSSLVDSVVERQRFEPFVFVVGGMSKGDVNCDWCPTAQTKSIRLGDRGMSAAAVCSTLCHAFEERWLSGGIGAA
jgi:rRNA small subunit pseudouridine methyltransferase Nep1